MEQEPTVPAGTAPVAAPQESVEAPVAEVMPSPEEETNVPESGTGEFYEEEGLGPQLYEEPEVKIDSTAEQDMDAADEGLRAVSRAGDNAPAGLLKEVMAGVQNDATYEPTDGKSRAERFRAEFLIDLEKEIEVTQGSGALVNAPAIINKAEEHQSGSMGIWKGFRSEVDLHPQAKYMTKKEKNNMAMDSYINHATGKVLSEMGYIRGATDIASMFILPEIDNVRSAHLASQLGQTYGVTDFANDAEFQGRLVAHIKSLDPEAAVAFFDLMDESLQTVGGGNEFYRMGFMADMTGDFDLFSKSAERGLMTGIQGLEWTGLAHVVGKVIKGFNIARKAVKVKSAAAQAQVVEAAIEGKLSDVGVSPMDGASSIVPGDTLGFVSPGSDNGLAKETVDKMMEVEIHLAKLDAVSNYGLALNAEDQAAAVKAGIKAMREKEGLLEISEVSRDAHGFTVSYKTGKGHGKVEAASTAEREALQANANETAQTLKGFEDDMAELGDDVTDTDRAMLDEAIEEAEMAKAELADFDKEASSRIAPEVHERTVSYTIDDVGTLKSDGKKGFLNWTLGIISPNTRFAADKRNMVQIPEQLNHQSGAIKGAYTDASKAALGDLNKMEYGNVQTLIAKGDELKEEYSELELLNGAVDNYKFSPKEAAAYRGMRQIYDHMHLAKNKQIVDGYIAQGFKMTSWGPKSQQATLKNYEDVTAARNGFSQANTKTHYVAKQGADGEIETFDFADAADMTDEFLQKQYADGYELTKVQNGHLLEVGDTHAEWAFVKKTALRKPSGIVLGKRPGYAPKLRKDGHFFMKQRSSLKIGTGKVTASPHTVRYFDNAIDANIWKQRQEKPDDFEVVPDGQMSTADRDAEYNNIGGGFITGARKQTDIPFGLEEQELTGEREDVLVGLQKYINHLSKQMPAHLYRMALREQWIKSAKEMGALKGDPVDGFDGLLNQLDPTHPAQKFLEKAHNQVSLISGIPTKEEKFMKMVTTHLAHWLEDKTVLGAKMARWLHGRNATAEITGLAKGSTFGSLLGMYNPAQWFIQSSGGLVALSVDPIHGIKGVKQSMGYALMDGMVRKNPGKLDEIMAWAETKGIDIDGFRMYNESGIRESVISATDDFAGIWGDLPYDAGKLRKVVKNHTLFFQSGELVSARLSFATAFQRWRSANKGKTPTDLDAQDIKARAEQYRLNMSKPNNAGFQSNDITSVTAQFMQVQTKFAEKLFNSDFTLGEKTRLLGAQTAMFGAAGVPLVGWAGPLFLDMLGLNAENLTEGEMIAARNGGLTWFINDYMDINAIVTGRITLGSDILFDTWSVASENSNLISIGLGATGSLFEKGLNVIHQVTTAFNAEIYNEEDLDVNKTLHVTEVLLKSLAPFAGSVNNLMKSYDMTHSKFYRNKDGKAIFEWYDNNAQTILAQAGGLSPMAPQDYYEVNARHGGGIPKSNRNIDAKRIVLIMNQLGHVEDHDATENRLIALNALLTKYTGEDRKKVMAQVLTMLENPKDVWAKATVDLIADHSSALSRDFASTVKMGSAITSPKIASVLDEAGYEKRGLVGTLKDKFTGEE